MPRCKQNHFLLAFGQVQDCVIYKNCFVFFFSILSCFLLQAYLGGLSLPYLLHDLELFKLHYSTESPLWSCIRNITNYCERSVLEYRVWGRQSPGHENEFIPFLLIVKSWLLPLPLKLKGRGLLEQSDQTKDQHVLVSLNFILLLREWY